MAGVSVVPAAVGDVATPTKAAVEIERDGVGREGEGRGKENEGAHMERNMGRKGMWEGKGMKRRILGRE